MKNIDFVNAVVQSKIHSYGFALVYLNPLGVLFLGALIKSIWEMHHRSFK